MAWQTVQGWLATWIARHDEAGAESVPAHILRELSAYLECGILAHGFARARCADCTAEFLVAYSCKGRGVCPSCTTKRMAATAARNRYSVPCTLAGQRVSVRLYPDRVVIIDDQTVVAEHVRASDRDHIVYDWQHYVPLVQRKPGALRNGALDDSPTS